jgi:hypothetical protein
MALDDDRQWDQCNGCCGAYFVDVVMLFAVTVATALNQGFLAKNERFVENRHAGNRYNLKPIVFR